MFTVLLIMFSGIGIGYLCRRFGWLQKLGKPIFYVILLLLFLLGANVGNNQTIVNNLLALGSQALLIAALSTLGSVLAAWGVWKLFFKKEKKA